MVAGGLGENVEPGQLVGTECHRIGGDDAQTDPSYFEATQPCSLQSSDRPVCPGIGGRAVTLCRI